MGLDGTDHGCYCRVRENANVETVGGRCGATGGRRGVAGGRCGAAGGRRGAVGGRRGAAGGRHGAARGRRGAAGGRRGAAGGRRGAAEGRRGAAGAAGRRGAARRRGALAFVVVAGAGWDVASVPLESAPFVRAGMITVIVPTVVAIVVTIREVSDGVDRRCPFLGDSVDADAGSGCGCFGSCGRFVFGEAHCLGDVHGFLLVDTVKLLKVSLGLFGGCLPSGGLRHSPCPGGVRGRGCCSEEIRAKTRATAFGGRFGRVIGIRVIGIRVNGSVRCCGRCVKILNEEAELFFKEPVMPALVSLPSV